MFWQTKTDYEFGPFRIDAGERQLLRHGQIVPLTPKVFDVLLALVQHNGRILTKDEVIRLVWPDTTVEEGNLSRNISTLRCALGERPREGRYIETIPWRGYRFVAAVRQVTDHEQRPAIESIAILPLLNVNADAKLEYLADGIAETLTSKLAQLTNLRVTSRNSSFRYKGRDPDVKTIGRELKVQAVLIGRIAETEDMLSISVELVETVDDRHIWGAQYIRKRTDLLAAQETIAKQIAERLRIELTGGEQEMLVKRHTNNNEAYFALLKGRYHFNKLTFDGVQKASAYFREAIEKDANYALAYAGLADCNNYLNERNQAKQAVLKALELDESLGEAHASLGFFKFLYEWDFAGAESEFMTAVALSPNYAEAHHWYAVYLANMGRHDEAFREAELAVERDPLSLLMNMTAALNFYTGREYDRAIDQLKKVIEMEANFPAAQSVLGCVYMQKEMYDQALAQFEKVFELCKGTVPVENSVKILKAQAHARSGNIREAKKLLEETGDGPASSYSIAGVHAALGDSDKAFEFLRNALDQRDLQMVSLKVDPTLDPLRDDSRFVNLIREVGLPI
ncbi:MAG TPA: winged helix-turn-helix domain-containing protein [Pyrinomonadaceae bacterium]|nr:winged helix-turn-helix domain-containing protein [Pyrinomonadaceae bacterium]